MPARESSGLRLPVLIIAGTFSLVLLLLSLLTPFLPESLSRSADPVLSAACHRLPARSIELPWGITGLCARCTAFWAGVTVGVAMVLVMRRKVFGIPVSFLLLLPMILDGSLQYLGLYESSNAVRIVTGASCGIGLASILAALSTKRERIAPGWPSRRKQPAAIPKRVDKNGSLAEIHAGLPREPCDSAGRRGIS